MSKQEDPIDERIEKLEDENELLRERLEELETHLEGDEQKGGISLTRRNAMTGAAAAGLIGLGATGAASGQEERDELYNSDLTGEVDIGWRVITTSDGEEGSRTILGVNRATNGRGLLGSAQAIDGNNTRGLEGRSAAPNGAGLVAIAESQQPENCSALLARIQPDNFNDIIDDAPDDPGEAGTIEDGEPVAVRAVFNDTDEIGEDARPVLMKAEEPGDVDGIENALGLECDLDAEVHADLDVDEDITAGGDIHADGTIDADGDLEITGTKHFVQAVETPAGSKKVRYTSVEAGTPRTETSDVAEMDDGRAEVELPEHFGMVTNGDEPITVQVTPYADEEVKPQVVEQSTERLIVEDFSDTDYDYTFAYTVKGVREGFEDKETIVDDE